MLLMALAMELLSCACPAGVAVLCCKAVTRFCTVVKRLWLVLGATANESPAAGCAGQRDLHAREGDGLAARVSAGGDHRSSAEFTT